MPLIAEFGATVTTAQVARAAGIAEGTIFRVFADKDDLLRACVTEALRPDSVHADIAAIDLAQPLADRLVEAAETLGAYVRRIGTISGALHATGFRAGRNAPARTPGTETTGTATTTDTATTTGAATRPGAATDAGCEAGGRRAPDDGRARAMAETTAVLADLFAPEVTAGVLRRPADELAAAFFGMLSVVQREDLPAFGDGPPAAADVVDLFLYGAVSREEKR